jgi:phage recombination protein Bet
MTSELQTSVVDPEISAAITIYNRLQPLQDALGLKDLTEPEMQLFAMVAHHTGLDPFTRQIYAIKRGGKVTHQTGIDGYRSTAERTRQYRGSDPATFEMCACGEAGSPQEHPAIARVMVYRAHPEGVTGRLGEARWHELKPKHVKPQGAYGFLDDMWWQMPMNQLAKCAEANGLRKQFPRVLGSVYITEEMEQAGPPDNGPLVAAASQPTAVDRIAARRAAIEAARASVETGGEALFVDGQAIEREPLSEPMTEDESDAVPYVEEAGLTPAEFAEKARASGVGKVAMAGALDVVPEKVTDAIREMDDAARYRLAQSLGIIG